MFTDNDILVERKQKCKAYVLEETSTCMHVIVELHDFELQKYMVNLILKKMDICNQIDACLLYGKLTIDIPMIDAFVNDKKFVMKFSLLKSAGYEDYLNYMLNHELKINCSVSMHSFYCVVIR